MTEATKPQRVKWYRSPVPREDLKRLNRRSDLKGAAQTLGYVGLLGVTAAAAVLSVGRLHWALVVPIFYVHGMCYHFLINGFHELVHDSVFKTRWLNRFFLRVFSFLGMHNHHEFWASHTEHHKYTLHPPQDLEVVLPMPITLRGFLQTAFVCPWAMAWKLRKFARHATGRLEGRWEHHLFDQNPVERRKMFNWARFVLVGHAGVFAIGAATGVWALPVVVTLANFYGGGLFYLCNNSQHAGLKDNAPDFRLCCRTLYLNPFFRFLYWHMNYHTEHHMYAAVPCYNLGKLHRIIKDDLPPCPRGLYETWKQIVEVKRKQKEDPDYRYEAELPVPRAA